MEEEGLEETHLDHHAVEHPAEIVGDQGHVHESVELADAARPAHVDNVADGDGALGTVSATG